MASNVVLYQENLVPQSTPRRGPDKKKKGVSVRKALGDISNRIVHGAHEVNNTKQHQKTTELEIESAAIDKTLTDIELWPTTINTNTPSWYNNQNSSIDASYNY